MNKSHKTKLNKTLSNLKAHQKNFTSHKSNTRAEKTLLQLHQNNTSYPRDSSVTKEFEQVTKKYPTNIALRYRQRKMTYKELNEKANRLARYLQKMGVKKQDYVGIALHKSIDLIVAILATVKLGAIYAPIDASFPEERRYFFIDDAKIKILITQKDLIPLFSKRKLQFVVLKNVSKKIHRLDSKNLNVTVDPLDLIYLNYTSGSTGVPKGVNVMHRGVLRLVMNPDWVKISSKDRFLQISNISFDAATFEIWGALLHGACLCIYPYDTLTTKEVATFLENEKITQAMFTTRFFNLLVDHHMSSLKGVHYLFSVGEPMSVSHAKKAFTALKNTKILNGYGPTENTTFTTTYRISKNLKEIEHGVPIGIPISNTTVYILDKKLHPVRKGVVGEIYTGGDGVAKGYLNQKKLTQEKFIKDPFSIEPHAKMYRTGDFGKFLADGNIFFIGRADAQVKIRGFRIELTEIEESVRKIKNVKDCICLVCEEIEGEKQLALYVLAEKGVTSQQVREALALKLPPQMIPDFIIILEKFPMTPVGKIDRKILAFPRNFLAKEKSKTIFLGTKIAKHVMDVWLNILRLGKIDKGDNFFHIGGNSIKAVELSSRLSEVLKTEISSNLIFEEPIFENFTKKIEKLFTATKEREERELSHNDLFWIWRNREVRFGPSIGKEKLPMPLSNQYTQPKNIFLTGATGFVAAFFLETLLEKTSAKIHCLVRSKNKEEGLRRIKEALSKYRIWKKGFASRIEAICGDLEEKFLGLEPQQFSLLAKEIDSVFHIGAIVNHVLLYEKLKNANVQGTEEIIKFCLTKKRKPLHFISTTDVFGFEKEIKEDENLQKFKNLLNGYAQSKWIAEKMVMLARKKGLQASIYRLQRTIGSSKTGASPTGDFLWRMIQASIQIKMFPDVDFSENMTPVDFVADALLYISKKEALIGKEYHLFSPYLRSYRDIFNFLKDNGYTLKLVNYEHWKNKLFKESLKPKEEKLRAIVALFSELNFTELPKKILYGFENFHQALTKSSLTCPAIDAKIMKKYLRYYVSIGFLSKAKRR